MSGRPPLPGERQLRDQIEIPRLPKLPGLRQPGGWAVRDISMRARGFGGNNPFQVREPAGDPPEDFPGTRPEWAFWWALVQLGYQPDVDFFFEKMVAHLSGATARGEIDFVIPAYGIGVEIQGEHWHYAMGTAKIEQDVYRAAQAGTHGLKIIFVDENDVLKDPLYYAKEALAGVDHSKNPTAHMTR